MEMNMYALNNGQANATNDDNKMPKQAAYMKVLKRHTTDVCE